EAVRYKDKCIHGEVTTTLSGLKSSFMRSGRRVWCDYQLVTASRIDVVWDFRTRYKRRHQVIKSGRHHRITKSGRRGEGTGQTQGWWIERLLDNVGNRVDRTESRLDNTNADVEILAMQ
ncbi:unnamed protein product, partial [Sphacelaria rigidula]